MPFAWISARARRLALSAGCCCFLLHRGLDTKRVRQPRTHSIPPRARRISSIPAANMASTTANGQPTPPVVAQDPAVDPAANKRKRDTSEPTTNGPSHAVRLSQTQSDILEIVQEYVWREEHACIIYTDISLDTTLSRRSSSTHSATATRRNQHIKSKGNRMLVMTKRRLLPANCVMAHMPPSHSSEAMPLT